MQESNYKTATEFKAQALEHFRRIDDTGESMIVTYHGKPFIEVRPYRRDQRLSLDLLRGSVVSFDAAPWANELAPAGRGD